MPKPFGLTPTFKLVVPSEMQNRIWDLVCDAVEEGADPERFMAEIREAWAQALDDKKKRDLERLR